jgi:hypothetical protein
VIAIACAWAILTAGAGLALHAIAPRTVRPVLATTALIVLLGAYACLLLTPPGTPL